MRLLGLWMLLSAAHCASSARILAVLPIPARSHHNLFDAILHTLAARGHDVVNYSPFKLDKPRANYTVVNFDVDPAMENHFTKEEMISMMETSPIRATKLMWNFIPHCMDTLFQSKSMKELLKSEEKFDLIFLEPLVGQEALLALGHKFKAPVISLHPFGAFSLASKVAGNPLSLAYISDYSFPYTEYMTLYQRLLNAYSILSTLYDYYSWYLPGQDILMRKLFNDPTLPPLVDMVHNISLFTNNAHPYVNHIQPYTPNLISVGGIHLAKQRTPLPPDMKRFLDEAPTGVIYFSLGTVIPDQWLEQQFFDDFISVFSRLPQRVLWKTKAELTDLPSNILTAKWVPQQDVLAHPNLVLFITHGGIFSQQEAINAGVPVICIPFLGDQPKNAKFYEDRGVGVILPFKTLSGTTIQTAVTTVLSDPKYKENMVRLSGIFSDEPVSPADRLIFWVEYVLRHRGAAHLRPVSAELSWYQLALVDVVSALLISVAVVFICITLIIRKTLTVLRPNTAPSNKKTN